MRSKPRFGATARRTGLVATCVAVWLLVFGAPTLAASDQSGVIVEKDLVAKELTLHTGVVLQVTGATRLLSKEGTRIEFQDLAVAESEDGVVVADPDAVVRYEGRLADGVVDATLVQVMGMIPH